MQLVPVNNARAIAGGLVVGLVVMVGLLGLKLQGADHPQEPRFRTPLGRMLPNPQVLAAATGERVSLQQQLGGHPALLFVFGLNDCASCMNVRLEMRIINNEVPRLRPILIASGAGREDLLPYLRQMGVDSVALVDEHRELLHGIGLTSEPAVLVTDSLGRILLLDTRSPSEASHFPIGTVLHSLAELLATTPQKQSIMARH